MSQCEQRENVKFCQKLGKSTSETFQMIMQAYREEALGSNAVFKCNTRFAQGRDSLADDEHTDLPRTVKTEFKIQEFAMLVRAKRSQTVDSLAAAAATGISHCTRHKILSDDLNMSRVTQHSTPCILRQDQHDNHTSICSDPIHSADEDVTFYQLVHNWRRNMEFSVRSATEANNWLPGNRHHCQERRNRDTTGQKAR
jgi:hypothetical protein